MWRASARLLPALVLLLVPATTAAQQRVRISAQTPLLKTPEGPILGRLERGLDLPQGRVDRKAVEVTVEGWIFAPSLGATARDGFNAIVNDGQGQNLRAEGRPDARLIGRLSGGALVQRLETKNGWARVRRQAWVARLAVDEPPAATATTPPPGAATPQPPRDTTRRAPSSGFGDGSRAVAPRGAILKMTPGGETTGTLATGAEVRVLTRASGWTRVRVDAWVPDSVLETAASDVTAGVTAAEVRAEPARWIGQVVDWRLQVVAVQNADGLRPELPEGKPYLLTRGPLPESGFVYVLVTPEEAQRYRDAAPLREITARVRIRAPSSKYLPTPVVELIGEQ
ncbi:MAG: hypothetical protein ABJB33_04895 [Gemmatimonadota bacterium]